MPDHWRGRVMAVELPMFFARQLLQPVSKTEIVKQRNRSTGNKNDPGGCNGSAEPHEMRFEARVICNHKFDNIYYAVLFYCDSLSLSICIYIYA